MGGKVTFRFTEDQIKEIEEHARYLTVSQMCDIFKISQTTYHAARKEQPAVAEAYRTGKALQIKKVAKSLVDQAVEDKSFNAARFYLGTQAGWSENASHTKFTDKFVKSLDREDVAASIRIALKDYAAGNIDMQALELITKTLGAVKQIDEEFKKTVDKLIAKNDKIA